ncbi:hypothetical protein [Nostoc sp.]|uniref:hypothetical protein n=1 Tax=Nostoc sp. TaxID=1180 RepID=UPI002D7819DD|nr:hypothetical protein [Nostoc sp.]
MPEDSLNLTNSNTGGSDTKGETKRKRQPRKALPNAVQSNVTRGELSIKGKISSTPKSVASNDFPLFKTFLLSPEGDELFIKTTRSSIVSLSTGDRFASNITGYLVIL